jgi:fido (protein-threonine AMPylation protein)
MAAKKTNKSTKKPQPAPARAVTSARPKAGPPPPPTKKAATKDARPPAKGKAPATSAKPAPAKGPPPRPAPAKAPPAKPSSGKPAPAKPVAKPAPAKPAPAKPAAKSPPPPAPSSKVAKRPVDPPPRASSKGGKPSRPGKPSKPAQQKPLLPSRPPLREAPQRLVALPLPILAPPRRPSVEERAVVIEARLAAQTDDFRKRYEDSLDMSWIYHDSALEGVVYTFDELRTALSGQAPPVTDSSLQPTYDDIRRHKEAIEYVRENGVRKKVPITLDVVRKLYLILHPEEGDIKTVKYRKDIPQHRLYFHEYAPPDKIGYKLRQIIDWLNDPETKKTRNGIRIAARAHYDMLRVYPFATDSGKVARLFMNLLLMRTGLPPALIHSTERQRYYEALKGSATTVLQMVQEAVENALTSVEKLLDEHSGRKRAL